MKTLIPAPPKTRFAEDVDEDVGDDEQLSGDFVEINGVTYSTKLKVNSINDGRVTYDLPTKWANETSDDGAVISYRDESKGEPCDDEERSDDS